MKKIKLNFSIVILFLIFSQVLLGWDQGKVLDAELEETGSYYISEVAPSQDTWQGLRISNGSSEGEIVDIFTSYFLAVDNEKAEIKFIVDSGPIIKFDMYTWGGGIHNTARVYSDPSSSKYKKLISRMKAGKSLEIVIKNSRGEVMSFKLSLEGFTNAYNAAINP